MRDALQEAFVSGGVNELRYNNSGDVVTGERWTFVADGRRYFARSYAELVAAYERLLTPTLTLPNEPPTEEPPSDEVPTITLPYQPQKPLTIGSVKTWEYAVGTNDNDIKPTEEQINITPYVCCENTSVYCDCGEELQVNETTNYDEGVTILVRPHVCREYSHTAVRRVCDKLAEMLNEHFDATGD